MSHYERRFNPEKRHGLHSAEREAKWQPRSLLRSLSIAPGCAVLDLGCGTGFWTLPLADIVGASGTVWALDVSQEMLDALADRKPPKMVRLMSSELPQLTCLMRRWTGFGLRLSYTKLSRWPISWPRCGASYALAGR